MISQAAGGVDFGYTWPASDTEERPNLKSAQARSLQHPVNRGSLDDSDEVRRERYRRLAALIQEWEADPTGHDETFWPILQAELDRRDD